MRKTIWVSLETLKRHEFNRTLRLTCRDPSNFIRKFEIVSNIYQAALRQFMKLSGVLFIAYLALNSLGTDTSLTLQVGSVTASVPKAYYLAICSIIYLATLMSLNHLYVSINLRNSVTLGVRIPGFSSDAFRMIQGEEEISLGTPISLNHFLQERLPISSTLNSLILICFLTLLVPILAFGLFGINLQYQLLVYADINALEKIAAILGLAILVISYFYFALFYIPLPYKKNTSFIRWIVLYNLPRAYPEEQIARWVSDAEKAK